MRRMFVILGLVLMAAVGTVLPVFAQTSAPAAPAPPTPARELLRSWNQVAGLVTDVAEAMPEEKYSFKPTPEVRSFAEQLLHVAGANYIFVDTAKGEKAGPEDLSPAKYKTKADVVKVLRESFEAGAAVIGQFTDAQLSEVVKSPFGNTLVTRAGYWWFEIRHATEHYGQMVVYLRLNGIVPPATARAQARQAQAPPPKK